MIIEPMKRIERDRFFQKDQSYTRKSLNIIIKIKI